MIPQPKFDIGDKVFYAHGHYGYTEVQCPDCLGTCKWEVTTPKGEQFDIPCGTCMYRWYSTGKVKEYGLKYCAEPLTIGSVRIDSSDKEHPVRYMCSETGVGSGNIYEEYDLFTSESEALELAKLKAEEVLARIAQQREAEILRQKKEAKGKPSRDRIALKRLGKELIAVKEELARLKGEK